MKIIGYPSRLIALLMSLSLSLTVESSDDPSLVVHDNQGFYQEYGRVPALYMLQSEGGSNQLMDEGYELGLEVRGLSHDGGGYMGIWYQDDGVDRQGVSYDEFLEIKDDQGQVWSHGQWFPARTFQKLSFQALKSSRGKWQHSASLVVGFLEDKPDQDFDGSSGLSGGGDSQEKPPFQDAIYLEVNVTEIMLLLYKDLNGDEIAADENPGALPDRHFVLATNDYGFSHPRYYRASGEGGLSRWSVVDGDGAELDHQKTLSNDYGFSYNRLEMPGEVQQNQSSYQVEVQVKSLVLGGGIDFTGGAKDSSGLLYKLKEPISYLSREIKVKPGQARRIEELVEKDAYPADGSTVWTHKYKLFDRFDNPVANTAVLARMEGQGRAMRFKDLDWDETPDDEWYQAVLPKTDENGELSLDYQSGPYHNGVLKRNTQKIILASGLAYQQTKIDQTEIVMTMTVDRDTVVANDNTEDSPEQYATFTVEVKDINDNPVADGCKINVFHSDGSLERLIVDENDEETWEVMNPFGDFLETKNGITIFRLNGAYARHNPDTGVLVIATCVDANSEQSHARAWVKVIREGDLILQVTGPSLLAGDRTEDTRILVDYGGEKPVEMPIYATSKVKILGEPGAKVQIYQIGTENVLGLDFDLSTINDRIANQYGPPHAQNHGGQLDEEISLNSSATMKLDGSSWLELKSDEDLFNNDGFMLRMQVRPEEDQDLRGSLAVSDAYQLSFDSRGDLIWEVGTFHHQLPSRLNKGEWNDITAGFFEGRLFLRINEDEEWIEGPDALSGSSDLMIGQDFRGHLEQVEMRITRLGADKAPIRIDGLNADYQVQLNDQGEAELGIASTGRLTGRFGSAFSRASIAGQVIKEDFESGDDADDDDDWFTEDDFFDENGDWSWWKTGLWTFEKARPEVVAMWGLAEEHYIQEWQRDAYTEDWFENTYGIGDDFYRDADDFFEELSLAEQLVCLPDYLYRNPWVVLDFFVLDPWAITPSMLLLRELMLGVPTDLFEDGVEIDYVVIATLSMVALGTIVVALWPYSPYLKKLAHKLIGIPKATRLAIQQYIDRWIRSLLRSWKESPGGSWQKIKQSAIFRALADWDEHYLQWFTSLLRSPDDWQLAAHLASRLKTGHFDLLANRARVFLSETDSHHGDRFSRAFWDVCRHFDNALLRRLNDADEETFTQAMNGITQCLKVSSGGYYRTGQEVFPEVRGVPLLTNLINNTKDVPGVDRVKLLSELGRIYSIRSVGNAGDLVAHINIDDLFELGADEWHRHGRSIVNMLRDYDPESFGRDQALLTGFTVQYGLPTIEVTRMLYKGTFVKEIHRGAFYIKNFNESEFGDLVVEVAPGQKNYDKLIKYLDDAAYLQEDMISDQMSDVRVYLSVGPSLYDELMFAIHDTKLIQGEFKESLKSGITRLGHELKDGELRY